MMSALLLVQQKMIIYPIMYPLGFSSHLFCLLVIVSSLTLNAVTKNATLWQHSRIQIGYYLDISLPYEALRICCPRDQKILDKKAGFIEGIQLDGKGNIHLQGKESKNLIQCIVEKETAQRFQLTL